MLVSKTVIGSSCGIPSSGYVAQLFLLAIDDLLYLDEPADDLLCMQVLAKEGANLIELPLRPKNATYSETPVTNADGISYNVQLLLSYPTPQNHQVIEWANANRRRRWAALFQTVTGENLIAAELKNGLQLNISRSGFIGISLTGKFSHPLWKLSTIDMNVIFSGPTFTATDYTTDFELES
jgi:hypothetical protein